MPDWTPAQQAAIEAADCNILVSAAAGSGKTAVLVERVVRLITNKSKPVDIDSLLIVTFTNAAAAEMRFRISKSLNQLIRENPDDAYYKRQLTLLSNAKICTIDAFCSSLVKEHFYELSISQDFSMLDESELQLMEDSIISDVLDSFFESGDSDFISLFELLTTPGNEKPVIAVIKRMLRFIYAQPFPYKWFADAVELHNPSIPFTETIWYKYISDEVHYLFDYALELANENLSIINAEVDDEKLRNKFIDLINDDLTEITRFKNAFESSWDDTVNKRAVSFKTSPSTKKIDSAAAEKFKSNRKKYKTILSDEIAGFFISTQNDYLEDAAIQHKQLRALLRLVREVDNRLIAEKKEINKFSFSDVMHFAISLLFRLDENSNVCKTELADSLTKSYFEILVDEYQDTNEAQDLLFTYLSNSKNLFTVGDIKQSIYRFRLAMPHIFNQRKKTYSYYQKERYSANAKIILDKNFRSRKDICSYVNFIFSNLMSERVGELDYNSDEYLNNGAHYNDTDTASAQLKILTGVKGEDYDKLEAAYIAKTIVNKINSGELIKDGEKYRPVKYGDFAILMRKVSSHVNVYAQVLSEFNIPVICDNSSNLFENNEIRILLSFIRVIDNPMQDVPLLATMMSMIYGFTADDMAAIRVENNRRSLYHSVSMSEMPKAKAFMSDLQRLRSISVTMSVSSFIRFLIEDKSIIAYFNAMGNGEQRYQNVLKLIHFAKSFDSGVNVGLTAFVRYIDKIAESDKGINSAVLSSNSDNCVKIMSVHHSKGLEFPICIFAGVSRKYNTMDLSDKLLLNTDYGIGIKCHNEKGLYQYNSIPYLVIKNKNANELMSENLRVLYVAMTRAKEQFISFITINDLQKIISRLAGGIRSNGISPYQCSKISNDADLLLSCALMHKDAKVLRELSETELNIADTDFALDVEITDEIMLNSQETSTDFVLPDSQCVEQIRDKLSFKYNRAELSLLSSKLTASALDDTASGFEYIASAKPSFLNKGGLTPAQRGTAMHTFMQFCDYHAASSDLEGEIARIASLGHLTSEQASSLNKEQLIKFFSSNLADEIFSADRVYREIKVSSFVSSKELYDTSFDEKVLVQGIADCVIEKNGALTLIDYKTDNVKDADELLERYRKQVMFYKSAIAKTLDMPVVSTVLYSFKLGKCCYYK